jgi:anti-anti-sigma factor
MEVTTRIVGDVTVVVIVGSLDSNTAPQAQRALDAVGTSPARKVAVDFSALDYVSSAGLRLLLGLSKQVSAKGGTLRTFGLNQSVREVFEISGFAMILKVFPTETDALNGF